ncbi:MAG TPA: metal-dependent transcriptional regulator, partial [Gemmatimonadales bacterium]|nr:metal-dependent transcriptional regulator [Gemmatimonadales bacterium]
LRMIRRHRILEAYLVARLGYTWDAVHEEADRLEHAVSEGLIERMAEALGNPDADPHGEPIPTAEGWIEEVEATPLAEIPAGETVEIRRVTAGDPDRLRYLASIGLQPGALVAVVERQPFSGPITLRVAGQERVIGHELAECVLCGGSRGA